MLIFPTPKQSPLTGMVGYGGGASGLNIHGGCSLQFEDGDAGYDGAGFMWRLGSTTTPQNNIAQSGNGPPLHFDTFTGSNVVANTGPNNDPCAMPPGMTNSRYAPSGMSIYTDGSGGDESLSLGNGHIWGFVYPDAHNSMKLAKQWKQGESYQWFIGSDSDNMEFDWPLSHSYNNRASNNSSWGTSNQDQLTLNKWNFFRFGISQVNRSEVRFVNFVWSGSSWSKDVDITDSSNTVAQISNGNSARFQLMEGVTGYFGNVGYNSSTIVDDSDPPED